MRIQFTQAGGIGYFPGLNKPVTLELDHLEKEEAEELVRLIETVRFFDLPAAVGAPAKGAADYQYYSLTVEDGGRQHTVRVLVPVENRALCELIRAVHKHVKTARATGPGNPSAPSPGKPGR